MFNGEKVTLLEMLDAREQRAATQKELLETAPEASLLSATMNIPGEVKNFYRNEKQGLNIIWRFR